MLNKEEKNPWTLDARSGLSLRKQRGNSTRSFDLFLSQRASGGLDGACGGLEEELDWRPFLLVWDEPVRCRLAG